MRVAQFTYLASSEVSEETLLMYFESKRKCGGGDVDSIQYEEGSDEAIITFEEASGKFLK